MKLEKFKNNKELESAYAELEKDYTKKCQELAKLKKQELVYNLEQVEREASEAEAELVQIAQNSELNLQKEVDSAESNNKNFANEFGTIEDGDACLDSIMDTEKTPITCLDPELSEKEENTQATVVGELPGARQPVFMSPTWVIDAKEFFAIHPEAECLEHDILNALLADSDLACGDNALETAACLTLGKNLLFGMSESLADIVARMPIIRAKAIEEYIRELRNRPTPPPRVETKSGIMVAATRPKYKSIAEAGRSLLGKF